MTPDQINRLYDYTKFHIGLYAGLMTALMGLLTLSKSTDAVSKMGPFLKITLVCFGLAGACGGIIGSTISLAEDQLVQDQNKIGPLTLSCLQWFTASQWAHLEHWFFWIGIAVSVVAFIRYVR